MGNCWGIRVDNASTSTTRASTSGATNNSRENGLSGLSSNLFSPAASGNLDEIGTILPDPDLKIYSFAELRSVTRNFRPDSVLGEGGFGRVYKGWVEEKTLAPSKPGTGIIVAVKKLNDESVQGLEQWQSEVSFLGRLSHPNLVKLLGYCWEDTELLLVYEFMQKGSLENHLFRRNSAFEPLPWEIRLKILIGAARGLAFLHMLEKKVIYRDFKSSNILLDANYNAKLSDFGLAKLGPSAGDSHVTTRVMGTYGYAAPEYIATGHLYVQSDVYGFGVVLLEMLSGLRALDTNRPSAQTNLVDWAKPYLSDGRKLKTMVMDNRLEGKYPLKGACQAAQLSLNCLRSEPKTRPSMKEVVDILEKIAAIKEKTKESIKGHKSPMHHRSPLHQKHEGRGVGGHQY